MTDGERRKYFAEWQDVRKVLRRQGVPAAECDARRHALHVEALGCQKSSNDFSSDDLTEVLKVFRAISQSGSINAQLDLQENKKRQKIWVMKKLCRELAMPWPEYANGIARRMHAEGKVSSAEAELLEVLEMQKVLAALNGQVRRKAGKFWKRGKEKSEVRSQKSEGNLTAHSTSSGQAVGAEGAADQQEGDPF